MIHEVPVDRQMQSAVLVRTSARSFVFSNSLATTRDRSPATGFPRFNRTNMFWSARLTLAFRTAVRSVCVAVFRSRRAFVLQFQQSVKE